MQNLMGVTPIELMIEVTQRGMQPNLSYRGGTRFNFGSDTVSNRIEMLPLIPNKKHIPEARMEMSRYPIGSRSLHIFRCLSRSQDCRPVQIGYFKQFLTHIISVRYRARAEVHR